MRSLMSGPDAEGAHGRLKVDLEDVRHVEISYSRTRPHKAELAIEYAGGRVETFEVDRTAIERLLEQLEHRRT
jgi:hypothetical protein